MAATGTRPSNVNTTKPFPRYEAPAGVASPNRSRASTLANEVLSEQAEEISEQLNEDGSHAEKDVFEKKSLERDTLSPVSEVVTSPASVDNLPSDFDELPIELISLSDRFVSSLTTAKIYANPPSAEKLSEIFQEFYLQADAHIDVHIQALLTKQAREASPARPVPSRTSSVTNSIARINSRSSVDTLDGTDRVSVAQQMLTPQEISDRRRARRLLERKRVALEEALERHVCEAIYDRIWRHKSSLDEVRDEKLRSRTAALALVGIDLKDLGIDLENSSNSAPPVKASPQIDVEEWISKARDGLLSMNESHNPLGKLRSLASTHQNIVDFLSALHQSSSSADEILPTLIYTLISCPPEGINIISNMNFIQRFRSAKRMNGEAAYCLTNLEAAIVFLETVDLATLRSEEAMEVNSKHSSRAPTPESGTSTRSRSATVGSTSTPVTAVPTHLSAPGAARPLISPVEARPTTPSSPSHHRRLSSLFQSPANPFGAASDAVRNTADQSFKNISSTLDNSFKVLFGRLREQQQQVKDPGGGGNTQGVIVPKTLDDARRLVSPKPILDEEGNISETSSFTEQDEYTRAPPPLRGEDRVLEMVMGTSARARNRDRSADSSSGNRPVPPPLSTSPPTPSTASASGGGGAAAVESMRSLGNSLNPLNRLAGMTGMRGFGRSSPAPAPASSPSPAATSPLPLGTGDPMKELKEQASDPPTATVISAIPRIDPPLKRFMEAQDIGELHVYELDALLKDYQRLGRTLKALKLR